MFVGEWKWSARCICMYHLHRVALVGFVGLATWNPRHAFLGTTKTKEMDLDRQLRHRK